MKTPIFSSGITVTNGNSASITFPNWCNNKIDLFSELYIVLALKDAPSNLIIDDFYNDSFYTENIYCEILDGNDNLIGSNYVSAFHDGNKYYLRVELTHLIDLIDRDSPLTIVLHNNYGSTIYIENDALNDNYSFVDFKFIRPFENKFDNCMDISLGDNISSSVSIASGMLNINVEFFKNILPVDISMVYDHYNDYQFLFFPKRWRPNFLSYLTDINVQESIVLVGTKHSRLVFNFVSSSNYTSNDYYIDNLGLGLVIEDVGDGYKLFELINPSIYMKFNYNGLLISSNDDKCSLSVTYLTNEIDLNIVCGDNTFTLTVTRENIVISQVNCDVVKFSTCVGNDFYYSLFKLDSNNYLTNMYEYKNDISTIRNISFNNNSNNDISAIVNYANESINIDYDSNRRTTYYAKNVNNNRITALNFYYSYLKTKIRNINRVYYEYRYGNDFKPIINYENQADQKFIYKSFSYYDEFDRNVVYLKNLLNNKLADFSLGNDTGNIYSTNTQTTVFSGGSINVLTSGRRYLFVLEIANDNITSFCTTSDHKLTLQLVDGNGAVKHELNVDGNFNGGKFVSFIFKPSQSIGSLSLRAVATNLRYKYYFKNMFVFGLKNESSIVRYDSVANSFIVLNCNSITYHDDFLNQNVEIQLNGSNYSLTLDDFIVNKIMYYYGVNCFYLNGKKTLIRDASNIVYVYKLPLIDITFPISSTKVGKMNDYYFQQLIEYVDINDGNLLFIKRKTINNENYEEIEKYNANRNLIYSEDFKGNKKQYIYDSENNVIEEKSGFNLDIVKQYTYSNRYVKTVSEKIGSNFITTENFYLNNKHPVLISQDYDDGLIIKEKFYDDFYGKITRTDFTNSDSDVDNLYANYNSDELIESVNENSVNVFGYGYDNYHLVNQIVLNNNVLLSISNVLFDADIALFGEYDKTTLTYSNNYSVSISKNKYGNTYKIKEGDDVKVTYLYFDTLPSNIDSLDSLVYSNFSSSSKLYKVIDNYSNLVGLYTYDLFGKVASYTLSGTIYQGISFSESVQNTYSLNGNLTSSVIAGITYQFDYNINNEMTTIVASNNASNHITSTYAKNANNFISRYSNKEEHNVEFFREFEYINGSKYVSCCSDFVYKTLPYNTHYYDFLEYDRLGNIISVHNKTRNKNNISGTFSNYVSKYHNTYLYDSFSRLIRENNQQLNKSIIYNYDQNGNIVSIVEGDFDSTNNPVLTNSTTTSYTYDSTYKDKLIAFNATPVSYDSFNNITGLGTKSFTYTRGNLLSSFNDTSKSYNLSFNYDKDGFRIRKVKTNRFPLSTEISTYFYNGNNLVKESKYRKSGISLTPTFRYSIEYIYGVDGVAGFIYNNTTYMYRKNFLNDIIGIYRYEQSTGIDRSNMILIASYKYDAYGNHTVEIPSDIVGTDEEIVGEINPFRYRSYYFDTDCELYYCQSRYYSPLLRRWLTMDSFDYLDANNIHGINLFCYAKCNPIMYSDPSGHYVISTAAWIVLGISIALMAAGTAVIIAGATNNIEELTIAGALMFSAGEILMGAFLIMLKEDMKGVQFILNSVETIIAGFIGLPDGDFLSNWLNNQIATFGPTLFGQIWLIPVFAAIGNLVSELFDYMDTGKFDLFSFSIKTAVGGTLSICGSFFTMIAVDNIFEAIICNYPSFMLSLVSNFIKT